MNRYAFPRFNFRIATAGLLGLASISSLALAWAAPLANGESTRSQRVETAPVAKANTPAVALPAAEAAAPALLKAERRGFPLMNLRDGRKLATQFRGASGAETIFASAATHPLTMINGDLDNDGAQELVVGHGGDNGGYVAIYRGNPDARGARTPEIFEGLKAGRFPAPFLPEAALVQLPIAPDFVAIGDFDRDGAKDIVVASRGATHLVLLRGNSAGGYAAQDVELGGRVTAMVAELIDPLDAQTDLAVAIADGAGGAQLLVFNDSQNAIGAKPEVHALPAEATALAVGQLDDHPAMDIAIAAGGQVAVLHGRFPARAGEQPAAAPRLETVAGGGVVGVRVGNFIWDRENQPELGLLMADGSVQILERGAQDKRMFTAAEWKTRWRVHRAAMEEQEAMRKRNDQPAQPPSGGQQWSVADSVQVAAPADVTRAGAIFTSARMTPFGVEDLLVVDAASRRVHVLLWNNEELRNSEQPFSLSSSGQRAVVTLDVEGAPVAALPMRLSLMNRPGLVLLTEGEKEITYAIAAPAATFTVNTTADSYDGSCTAGAGGCSFRDALDDANAGSTSDLILIPSGTITINTALGGPDEDTTIDPAAQQSGDWDVFFDTTITGAGQGATILQAAAAQPGHDRVLDAIQTGVGIPDLTVTDLTIRNGRCRADFPCVDGGGMRYAVDNQAVLTMTNVTVDNNRTEVSNMNPANNGGGIFGGQSDFNYTNVTVTNNTAAFVASGCTGATLCGGEGGGIFSGIRFTANPTAVVLNGCTITGNTANSVNGLGGRGGAYAGSPDSVSITNGSFSNNTAFTDAGGLRLFTPTTINGATISGNTARQNGGGIWSDPLANDNTPQTNTFTNVVMKGNRADSDGVIGPNNVNRGDGGAIFHGRGTLHLNNPTIGGTGMNEGNTAFDGGGIARTYSQFTSAVFNASTLNINSGGSIVGNEAINNGGGIINDATKSAAAGNASSLNMTGATAVTFTNNRARNHGGGLAVITGAGSSGPAAAANLNNMALRSNQANSDASGGGDGGALMNDSGGVSGGGTVFTGTLAIGGSGTGNSAVNGGGIRNSAGSVTVPASPSITHNTASGNGAGISNNGTMNALASATITNNTATGNGGGIHNSGTLGALTNPALNSNAATNGGGIFSTSGNLVVSGGSVSNNTAGGGIVHSGAAASSVTNASINGNTGHGISITANSMDVSNNAITGNSGDGIAKTGSGTGSHFNSNIIHSNGGLALDLGDNGVTPNDPNDADTGPNNLQNFPVLNYVRRADGVANVTLNAPNGKYRIQYYANMTCDPSGHGEGQVLLTSEVKDITSGNTLTFFSPALAYGALELITATATHDANGNGNFDDDGSTSEFSACRQVNRLPTFSGVQSPSRQQGSAASNGLLVTVNDLDQAANTLSVTVNGAAMATVNGVTVSNIAIAANGNITADVVASCTATDATFTLRATDNATEFTEQMFTVTVTANTPPTLGNYASTLVNAGSSGTIVTPDAAPADNGTIAMLTASAPGFTGTFVGNTSTGAITINNAGPFGTYTVTVTATDNCGAMTTTMFQLTVNAIPTISAQSGVTRQRGGGPVLNSQIATVNDDDQAEETLTVTVNGGASATVNDVTVSNLAISPAGVVTADVVGTCSASTANFTLRVTDTNGAFNESMLTVTMDPNANPTLGTYPGTSVLAGSSGTVVTPDNAPADNGSIVSLTASAPGFSGTLTGNPTTGEITVDNAGPAGAYTVTVTATDNCGASVMTTFQLNVNQAPAFTSANSATFVVGMSDTFTVTTSGFPPPTITIGGDPLPFNLTFTDNGDGTATISGMPAAGTGGVYNITFFASNGVNRAGDGAPVGVTQNFTLTVNEAPTITSANSLSVTEGNTFSFPVTTTGFPDPTVMQSGALPTGVMFSGSTLSGTPADGTAGNYPMTFTASNGVGSDDTQNFTLTVNDAICVPPPSDALAWFPGEDNAAEVQNGRNGTAQNGAGFAAGKVGQGFTFDGANAVVQVPDDNAWDFGSAEFTVQTWVKFNAISGTDVLVAHDEGGGATNKWIFWLQGGALEFHLNGAVSANIRSDANFAPVLGQWYHVAVTRSGNTYKFYVDGAQNGTDQFDSNVVPDASAPLTLGQAEALNAINGMLDEVQIFSRALSPLEIAGVYNASTEGLCFDAIEATGAVSRKTHGAVGDFDIALPLSGAPGIECRSGGANGEHTIVVTFNNVVVDGTANVSAGSVMGAPTFNGREMTIQLTGVTNAQSITITLSDVDDGFGQTLASVVVPMNVLLGDATANNMVNASDVAQVKANSGGSPVDATNFRNDLTVDGSINASDIGTVKTASGTSIP